MADELTAAILLSTSSFEDFFGRRLSMTSREFAEWEGGWTASYCRMLSDNGIRPLRYVPSVRERGVVGERFPVRLLPLRRYWEPWHRWPVLGRTPAGRYAAQLVNTAAMWRSLHEALVADGVDVLIVQEYWTARYDVLVTALDLPIVAVHQGLVGSASVKFAKPRTLPRARRVITMTHEDARVVEGYGGTAVRIANAVRTDFFTPNDIPPASEPTVMTVARLNNAHKRVSDLIKAMALLPDDWRLQIVGAGSDRQLLERVACDSGVAERVEFTGLISGREELRERLRRCDVFVLASAREGLPLALLEAMSCGAPVVASAIPANAGVITHGRDGLLVPVGRPTEIARLVLEAHARREELGRAARETVKSTYSERVCGQQLAAVVREAADR